MAKHRIYTTAFASVYPAYVAKAEKKGRTKGEVDQIIAWLKSVREIVEWSGVGSCSSRTELRLCSRLRA